MLIYCIMDRNLNGVCKDAYILIKHKKHTVLHKHTRMVAMYLQSPLTKIATYPAISQTGFYQQKDVMDTLPMDLREDLASAVNNRLFSQVR